ncbi:GNAT family N-acetyltransferase [Dactylosporangium sp. CA-092794]|uniref:GNAT family N-acetyltransferase n=1 Tax=Dactylosporangium sp. CA-092794 TaxID=3239929 RepID=UPI003D94424A
MSQPGWPAILTDGPVMLRPYRRSDARVWSEVRRSNEQWLGKWEPTPYGTWYDLNSVAAFRAVHADLRRAARQGTAMPFAVCYQDRLVGQLTLGNIVRRAFCSGYAGYWVDSRFAGKGIIPTALALVVDHAFTAGGLHRIEVNIRPDNLASRRVVEKLGFRQEAYHHRYLHIDGDWRDHLGYAMTTEDLEHEGLLARWHKSSANA